MNGKQKHIADLLRDDLTTVAVRYVNADIKKEGQGLSRPYVYKILKKDAEKLTVNDYVVVPVGQSHASPTGTVNVEYMHVAVVAEIHDMPQIDVDFEGDYKWVMACFNLEHYNAVTEHDKQFTSLIQTAEKEVKRASLLEQFQTTLKGNAELSAQFAKLRQGPALLEAPTKFSDAPVKKGARK